MNFKPDPTPEYISSIIIDLAYWLAEEEKAQLKYLEACFTLDYFNMPSLTPDIILNTYNDMVYATSQVNVYNHIIDQFEL